MAAFEWLLHNLQNLKKPTSPQGFNIPASTPKVFLQWNYPGPWLLLIFNAKCYSLCDFLSGRTLLEQSTNKSKPDVRSSTPCRVWKLWKYFLLTFLPITLRKRLPLLKWLLHAYIHPPTHTHTYTHNFYLSTMIFKAIKLVGSNRVFKN